MEKRPVTDMPETETETEPAIVRALRHLPPAEQHRLLEWSRGWGSIRYGALRGGKKAAAMLALTREHKAAWPLAKVMSLTLKVLVWDARSWTFRLGLGSLVATFILLGNTAASIVALGGGIGLPLWLLIGAGGILAGLLADRIQTQRRKRRHTA